MGLLCSLQQEQPAFILSQFLITMNPKSKARGDKKLKNYISNRDLRAAVDGLNDMVDTLNEKIEAAKEEQEEAIVDRDKAVEEMEEKIKMLLEENEKHKTWQKRMRNMVAYFAVKTFVLTFANVI